MGEGVEKDYSKAYEWYLKAANLGESSAQNNVAVCYLVIWFFTLN
jgi:uncharacterized protein